MKEIKKEHQKTEEGNKINELRTASENHEGKEEKASSPVTEECQT